MKNHQNQIEEIRTALSDAFTEISVHEESLDQHNFAEEGRFATLFLAAIVFKNNPQELCAELEYNDIKDMQTDIIKAKNMVTENSLLNRVVSQAAVNAKIPPADFLQTLNQPNLE